MLYSKLSEVTHHNIITVSLFSLYSEAPEVQVSSLGGQNAGGLIVGGGIGGANGTRGGGEPQQGEIEKLNQKIEEMKEQAREDSRITMDNLTNVRNERVEDDELRTEEREAMEGRLNDLEKELKRQAALQITPTQATDHEEPTGSKLLYNM